MEGKREATHHNEVRVPLWDTHTTNKLQAKKKKHKKMKKKFLFDFLFF